jgi:hypothetical protein
MKKNHLKIELALFGALALVGAVHVRSIVAGPAACAPVAEVSVADVNDRREVLVTSTVLTPLAR